MQSRGGMRHDDLSVAPYTADDETAVGHLRDGSEGLAFQCRIDCDKLSHVGVIFVCRQMRLQVGGLHKELAHDDHGQNDTHDTQRIGDGTAQGGASTLQSHLLQGLLGGTQSRRIGSGSAKNTNHVGHVHGQNVAQKDGHERTRKDDGQPPEVELDTFVAQRTEEVGAYIEAKRVDKHGESEALGKEQDVVIERETIVTADDTDEENKGYAERNALIVEFAKCKSQGTNGR